MGIMDSLFHGWNAFGNRDPTNSADLANGYSYRPDRVRLSRGNEKSIITSIYNRIALDVAAVDIVHCRVDDNNRYEAEVESKLNRCLKVEANLDQTARAFRQDLVMSLFDEGCVAIVPVDTNVNPKTGAFDISSMRSGKIVEWYPKMVKLRVYNEEKGIKEEIILPKSAVGIIENPLYAIMNEPNSTLQRLIRKLALLDLTDERNSSGKLDLIIQLPYLVKSEGRKNAAEIRRKEIEKQLTNSKYGIAYTDGTEHITQLNRPAENNLLAQVQTLTESLYAQLGITQAVMDGTADEQAMLNYYNRTVEPIVSAIVEEMRRKFLTKTARTQGQSILSFRDPFKLVPINNIADIADKFTRNEILSSNELRQIIGVKPSDDPKADELVNSNISQPNEGDKEAVPELVDESKEGE